MAMPCSGSDRLSWYGVRQKGQCFRGKRTKQSRQSDCRQRWQSTPVSAREYDSAQITQLLWERAGDVGTRAGLKAGVGVAARATGRLMHAPMVSVMSMKEIVLDRGATGKP